MKNFKNYLSFLAVFALLFSSCSKDETPVTSGDEVAVLTFGTDLQGMNSMNKQQDVEECIEGDPAIAQLTIEYGGSSETVYVPVLGDENGGYFTAYSEDLEIPVPSGSDYVTVELTDFVVWTDDDDDGNGDRVLWVAPKVGSDYAQFVTNALGGDGYTWNLRAGSKTYTDVEVLCFDNRDVNRYGYQFFDIIPNELQTLCFFANYCTDDGRHFTANYSLDLYTFSGEPSEDRPTLNNSYTNIYSDEMPDPEFMGNNDGVYYADPLCLSVPLLGEGEYIYYEATVENWDGNYTDPANYMVWGYLSQDDIDELVEADGDGDSETMDYQHLFFNCPEGDSVVVTPPDFDCTEDFNNATWSDIGNCNFYYVNGTNDFVEVGADTPLFLAALGSNDPVEDLTIRLDENDDLEIITTEFGLDFASGFEVVVTDNATFCESFLLDYRPNPESITASINDLMDLSKDNVNYPLWVKVRVLVCPPDA